MGITGTPTVNLGTGNTVGINGSVTVGNSSTNPVLVRDVDNAARHFLQASGDISIANTAEFSISLLDVPSGKRLVIEYVSLTAAVPTGEKLLAMVTTLQPFGAQLSWPLPLISQGTFGTSDKFVAGQPVRLYVNPGGNVSGTLIPSITGSVSGTFTISGYLVDCGAGSGCPLP